MDMSCDMETTLIAILIQNLFCSFVMFSCSIGSRVKERQPALNEGDQTKISAWFQVGIAPTRVERLEGSVFGLTSSGSIYRRTQYMWEWNFSRCRYPPLRLARIGESNAFHSFRSPHPTIQNVSFHSSPAIIFMQRKKKFNKSYHHANAFDTFLNHDRHQPQHRRFQSFF